MARSNTNTENLIFQRALKMARLARGLTQRELSLRGGCGVSNVSQHESGYRGSMHEAAFLNYAEALELAPHQLLEFATCESEEEAMVLNAEMPPITSDEDAA